MQYLKYLNGKSWKIKIQTAVAKHRLQWQNIDCSCKTQIAVAKHRQQLQNVDCSCKTLKHTNPIHGGILQSASKVDNIQELYEKLEILSGSEVNYPILKKVNVSIQSTKNLLESLFCSIDTSVLRMMILKLIST